MLQIGMTDTKEIKEAQYIFIYLSIYLSIYLKSQD